MVDRFDWTDAAVERLKAAVADGMSSGQIAAAFGVPRNSIIGKCHRLGLSLGGGLRQPSVVPVVRSHGGKPAVHANPVAIVHQIEVARETVAPTIPGWPKPKTDTAIHFLSDRLRARHCRMPLWDDATPRESRFYCGAEVVPGKSWCPACVKLVYGQGTPGERDAERVLKRVAA